MDAWIVKRKEGRRERGGDWAKPESWLLGARVQILKVHTSFRQPDYYASLPALQTQATSSEYRILNAVNSTQRSQELGPVTDIRTAAST
jgi:hypothetical protein